MVLVDSSVWIRFLLNRPPYAAHLDQLLDVGEVVGHDLVYGELLIGDSGARQSLLTAYERMNRISTLAHKEVAAFVRAHRLYGRGVGWVDVHLLASSLVSEAPLWTADKRLAELANELHTGYTPR